MAYRRIQIEPIEIKIENGWHATLIYKCLSYHTTNPPGMSKEEVVISYLTFLRRVCYLIERIQLNDGFY